MTTVKLKNWQDARGSQLERAKKVIMGHQIKLVELSKLTKIPYQTLVNYRQNIDSLDNANWQYINKLAQAYDIVEIQNGMTQLDVFEMQATLNYLFDKLPKTPTVNRLKQIVTSDPVIVYELFKAK